MYSMLPSSADYCSFLYSRYRVRPRLPLFSAFFGGGLCTNNDSNWSFNVLLAFRSSTWASHAYLCSCTHRTGRRAVAV